MLLEIEAKINGNLLLSKKIELKKYPYIIKVFEKEKEFFISFSRKILDIENAIPKIFQDENNNTRIKLPNSESYQDILNSIRHIESFGALDNRLLSIDTHNIKIKFIPENENDHLSPLKEITRELEKANSPERLTKDWLQNIIINENQMGDLYIPFSFYRDATELYNKTRYQSAFCTYFMMLEYFYHEKHYGIQNDAYTRMKSLNSALLNTLEEIKKHPNHYNWLVDKINKRQKKYNPAGLLFTINRFRDELSHAVDKNKNRNTFNDFSFNS
ncbi:hypothetical protein [Zobellia roscoffensis]|uniref:hypothetical protein n=1 Tax=Zobellia roscoffensis TaxID=2779508 RepID=UPI001889FF30|nr:hypothetical protein [Zobellia roscoffensis]